MGWVGGKAGWSPLPWGRKFEVELMSLGDTTYRFTGDELLHEIHKCTIETNHINLHLHKIVRRRLNMLIGLNAVVLVLFLLKFGL